MVGLRSQESTKFKKYFELVQEEAQKINHTFFLECGEGNEFSNDNMECEDLRGWLIPNKPDVIKSFEEEFNNDTVSDKWIDYIKWVEWKTINDTVIISFISY